MSRRRYDTLESIRRRAGMSERIVSTKDADYALYSGGSFEISSKLAMIDTMLRIGLIPAKLVPFIKFYRDFLNQQRKAFFASVGSSEISKLGFILGLKDDTISAT